MSVSGFWGKIDDHFDTQTNHSIKLEAKDVILYYEDKNQKVQDCQFINFSGKISHP